MFREQRLFHEARVPLSEAAPRALRVLAVFSSSQHASDEDSNVTMNGSWTYCLRGTTTRTLSPVLSSAAIAVRVLRYVPLDGIADKKNEQRRLTEGNRQTGCRRDLPVSDRKTRDGAPD